MDITGTLLKTLQSQSGKSPKGQWTKREFVIQTSGPYAKEVVIAVFNQKGDILDTLSAGQEVKVSFDLESKEYKGRYSTSVLAFKIQAVGAGPVGSPRARPAVQRRVEPVVEVGYEREYEDRYGDDSDTSQLPF